jgi:hypothetical protein
MHVLVDMHVLVHTSRICTYLLIRMYLLICMYLFTHQGYASACIHVKEMRIPVCWYIYIYVYIYIYIYIWIVCVTRAVSLDARGSPLLQRGVPTFFITECFLQYCEYAYSFDACIIFASCFLQYCEYAYSFREILATFSFNIVSMRIVFMCV